MTEKIYFENFEKCPGSVHFPLLTSISTTKKKKPAIVQIIKRIIATSRNASDHTALKKSLLLYVSFT